MKERKIKTAEKKYRRECHGKLRKWCCQRAKENDEQATIRSTRIWKHRYGLGYFFSIRNQCRISKLIFQKQSKGISLLQSLSIHLLVPCSIQSDKLRRMVEIAEKTTLANRFSFELAMYTEFDLHSRISYEWPVRGDSSRGYRRNFNGKLRFAACT